MPKEESVSEGPSMLIDGPIPSEPIEEISVTFLPQFLGALPRALCPLGALPYLGVSATLVEDSSTNTNRFGSTPPQAIPEGAPLPFVSLGGHHRLFLKVQPSLRTARLIVETETATPVSLRQSSQWRAKVASSLASSCSQRARRCSWVARMRGVRPGEGRGARPSP